MKQGITNEQFLNLTFEQSLKLMDIMGYPQENSSKEFYYNNKHVIARRFSHIIEKITIGKMFEIIDKKWFIKLNPLAMDSQYNFELKITERKDCKSENDYVIEKVYHADELCDVLFKALTDQCLI